MLKNVDPTKFVDIINGSLWLYVSSGKVPTTEYNRGFPARGLRTTPANNCLSLVSSLFFSSVLSVRHNVA